MAPLIFREKLFKQTEPLLEDTTWEFVESKLALTWSPQQISGYLLVNNQPGVSHQSIYRRIYADKRKAGSLHLALRCQKVRKKRHSGRARKGSIPNQLSIDSCLSGWHTNSRSEQRVAYTAMAMAQKCSSWAML